MHLLDAMPSPHRNIEVRCCCDPSTYLGRIRVPWCQPLTPGEPIRFDIGGGEHISLTPAFFIPGNGVEYIAFKAENIPLQLLCKIPQFFEYPSIEELRVLKHKYAGNPDMAPVLRDMFRSARTKIRGTQPT